MDGLDLAVEAAVSETLPSSVLLGTDVAELATLLGIEACVQPGSSIHGETNSSCARRST